MLVLIARDMNLSHYHQTELYEITDLNNLIMILYSKGTNLNIEMQVEDICQCYY